MRCRLLFVLPCALILPGWVVATLPVCSDETSNCTAVANSECTGELDQPCVCLDNFHENADGSGCDADVTPGMTCTTKDSDMECVSDATCLNTASEGATEVLQCTCNDGFRPAAPPDGENSAACKPAFLPTCVEDVMCESVPYTICEGVNQPCICIEDYHENSDKTGCEADIEPGSLCTIQDSDMECINNATCVNTAEEGAAEAWQCTCDDGFHPVTTLDGSLECQADFLPGERCSLEASVDECVDGATCKTQVGNSVSVSECECNPGYYVLNKMGVISCARNIVPGNSCTTKDVEAECVSDATCIDTAADGETELLLCVCNDGFHTQTEGVAISCAADIAPGEHCRNDSDCVDGAACVEIATDGTTDTPQCRCREDFHQKTRDDGVPFCEADLPPGRVCTLKDDNSECKEGATCVDTAAEGAVTPSLQCVCNEGFHLIDREGTTVCEADKGLGEACTMENNPLECRDNAACWNTAGQGHTADLRCTCDTNYHEAEDSSGSKTCEADTCRDTVTKCSVAGTDDCAKANSYIGCLMSGVCEASAVEDVGILVEAFSAARGDIPDDCTYSPDTTCQDKLTRCFNTFLKEDLSCGVADALGTCIQSADCSTVTGTRMAALARAVEEQIYDELSCACIQAADACFLTQTSAYDNAADADTKCAAVKGMFGCAMTSDCDVTKAIDSQKLSSVWSSAFMKAQNSTCEIAVAEGTTCQAHLTICGVRYATGLKSADTREKKCTKVLEFKECLDDDDTNDCADDKMIFLQELMAAESSYSCECVVEIADCRSSFNTSLQAGDDMVCRAVADYQSCAVWSRCNMTDALDNTRVTEAHSVASKTKADKTCTIVAGTSCSDNLNACADTYVTKMAESVNRDEKCFASSDLLLCTRAAKCSAEVDVEKSELTDTLNSTIYRHQSLGCSAVSCGATYTRLATCGTEYDTAFSTAGDDSNRKCIAINTYVDCMNDLLCNDHLKADIRARYTGLKYLDIPSCGLKDLLDTNASPLSRTSTLTLILAVTAAFWATRS